MGRVAEKRVALGWGVLGLLLALTALEAATGPRERWPGLVGDEATYLMQAESLAWDGDLRFAAEDLERFRERRGQSPEVILQSGDQGRRIVYGKPFLYALAIAPLVRLLGERGAVLGNAIALAVAGLFSAHVLVRQGSVWGPLWIAVALFASVAFGHVFWIHPDLFLMAASASGLALAHLLQATPPLTPRAATWGRALAWSAAGALLALPGVWRPPYLLLLAAGGGLALEPRSGRASRLAALAGGAAVVVAISVGGQELISGSWSPYGGERRGFSELEGFPGVDFPASEWSRRVESKGNTSWLGERTFEASLAPALLGWNLLYLIAGRTVGLAPYFLPAFAALLRRRGDRGTRLEQAIGLLVPLAFVALNPWNFYGGAGSVANRYFLPAYPLFWFAGAGAARSVLSTLAAAPFLAALWAAPAAYPVTPDGPRYVAAAARRFLPIETTQRHVKAPGRADVVHGDLWVRFLDASVRPSAAGPDRLALQAGHPAEILVGRGAPLRALSIEAVAGAPVSLRVAGPGGVVRLQPPLDARLELDRPTARHRMWWSEAPFWLYRIELEAEAAAATTVELRLRAEAK